MGIFNRIKKNYEAEYDLENLEDLVYYDEIYDLDEDNDAGSDLKKSKSGKETEDSYLSEVERKRRESLKEEEKYEHLLNSVQAQELIKTVDKFNHENTGVKTSEKNNAKTDVISKVQPMPVEDDFFKEKRVEIPNVSRKPKKLETVYIDKFKGQDIENYVKEQCDIMEEAAAYIENARQEYEAVTERFSDIQAIDEAPESLRKEILDAAETVDSLTIDRRIFKSSEQKLSNNAYHNMERYEDELPRGIKYISRQESYYEAVQRDMRMVEGERLGLRMESKQLVKRQLKIRKMAISFIVCILVVYAIFMVAIMTTKSEENMTMLLIVTGLAAVFALLMFAILKTTERQVLVTEIRLNKATALLNKIKIKYINAANTLDYEYNKYHVKSSYELAKKYEAYVQMKAEQAKAMQLTNYLNEAELKLEKTLKKTGVYDTHIWLGQVRALINPKEMVEVRHELNALRQKLRNQMEYNSTRIEEAKKNIKDITLKNPEYSSYALRIIEMYEQKNRKNIN